MERESQRKIVLGEGGQTIKAIGEAARKEIAAIVEVKVHLFLFVKVREGWGDDPERYRAMDWSSRKSDWLVVVGHVLSIVMPGFMPGIHVLVTRSQQGVDGRDKPGHDAGCGDVSMVIAGLDPAIHEALQEVQT